jgi:hypothetical protein
MMLKCEVGVGSSSGEATEGVWAQDRFLVQFSLPFGEQSRTSPADIHRSLISGASTRRIRLPGKAASSSSSSSSSSSKFSSSTDNRRKMMQTEQSTALTVTTSEDSGTEVNEEESGTEVYEADEGDPGKVPQATITANSKGTEQLDALLDIAKALDPDNLVLRMWKCNGAVTNETEVTCYCR